MARHPVTCGILAGGAASRMGSNKALLPFRGKPLLARQVDLLAPLFERLVVGASDASPYAPLGMEVVPDVLRERCSLTGIHAILSAARTDHAFVVACDLPFLNPRLIETLIERRGDFDVVVPDSDSGLEPLHAVYSRRCLPAIESCARRGEWKVSAFFERVRVDRIRVRDAEWAVEGCSPFTNVNTPQEWDHAAPE